MTPGTTSELQMFLIFTIIRHINDIHRGASVYENPKGEGMTVGNVENHDILTRNARRECKRKCTSWCFIRPSGGFSAPLVTTGDR